MENQALQGLIVAIWVLGAFASWTVRMVYLKDRGDFKSRGLLEILWVALGYALICTFFWPGVCFVWWIEQLEEKHPR